MGGGEDDHREGAACNLKFFITVREKLKKRSGLKKPLETRLTSPLGFHGDATLKAEDFKPVCPVEHAVLPRRRLNVWLRDPRGLFCSRVLISHWLYSRSVLFLLERVRCAAPVGQKSQNEQHLD